MPHHDFDATTITAALELLTKHGFDGLARPLEMLFNEDMRLERDAYLGAGPWERSDERRGYANGFKPKTVKSRVGDLELRVPKARGLGDGVEPFYPQSLERGSRIEQALGLALAEMYVQGVSTRKVKEITEQLCGREISSSQVSRLASAPTGSARSSAARSRSPRPRSTGAASWRASSTEGSTVSSS